MYFMKKYLFLFLFMGISQLSNAQTTIVFTSNGNPDGDNYWSVDPASPYVYHSISQELNDIAPLNGDDDGVITISSDGEWYAFSSERFDSQGEGWSVLTVVKTDMSSYEVIKESNGNAIHNDGLAFAFNSGNSIVFVTGDGNHISDVFVMNKTGDQWSSPINISASSGYDYNYNPSVSSDGKKILFDASPTSYPSTAICEVNSDGTNLSTPISIANISNGLSTHSGSYDPFGDIVFEGDDGSERIWKFDQLNNNSSVINTDFNNDNSPFTLSDGRIISLTFPTSGHQIKIMDLDGSNDIILTDSNVLFSEVYDIGISGYTDAPVSTEDFSSNTTKSKIKFHLQQNLLTIDFNHVRNISKIIVLDVRGRILTEVPNTTNDDQKLIRLDQNLNGIYFIQFLTNEGIYQTDKVLLR